MTERTPLPSPPVAVDPETRRAHQLDALAAVLPMDRRDRLAQLLTDDDVETLKHLARSGMGENTLRALAWDLAYLEAWAVRADRRSPALAGGRGDPLEVRLAKREAHRKHGMPHNVAESLREDGLLRSEGPYAPATSWPPCTAGAGSRGHSPSLPCGRRCGWRFRRRFVPRHRKRRRAFTRDVLDRDLRVGPSGRHALAILIVAIPSGGRRCSEAAGLRIEELREEPSVQKHRTLVGRIEA